MRAPQVADFCAAAWQDFNPPLTYERRIQHCDAPTGSADRSRDGCRPVPVKALRKLPAAKGVRIGFGPLGLRASPICDIHNLSGDPTTLTTAV